jgi:Resolvase, N terminal domain
MANCFVRVTSQQREQNPNLPALAAKNNGAEFISRNSYAPDGTTAAGASGISTDAQDLTAQLKDLKAAGCERVFKEKVTGATADRPQLKKLLAAVGHGDVVIIAAVDRLSRDTTDLLVIARDLQKAGAGWLCCIRWRRAVRSVALRRGSLIIFATSPPIGI